MQGTIGGVLAVDVKVQVDNKIDESSDGEREEDPEVMQIQAEVLISRVDPALPILLVLVLIRGS